MLQLKVIRHFDLPNDGLPEVPRPRIQDYYEEIEHLMNHGRLIVLYGDIGSGKTTFLDSMITRVTDNTKVIRMAALASEYLKIGHILRECIEVLSDGQVRPRRDIVAMKHQVRRLMGQTRRQQHKRILLVFDEAQRIHGNTLKAIKNMMEELVYLDMRNMFSVVLSGHPSLGLKDGLPHEVDIRAHKFEIPTLTRAELTRLYTFYPFSEPLVQFLAKTSLPVLEAIHIAEQITTEGYAAGLQEIPLEFYTGEKPKQKPLSEQLEDNQQLAATG